VTGATRFVKRSLQIRQKESAGSHLAAGALDIL
jgi:hypothetical protein